METVEKGYCPEALWALLIALESHRRPTTSLPRTEVHRAIRDPMATQIHTCSLLGDKCHRRRQVWLCQSQSRRGRGRRARNQQRGTCPQWCRALSMMPAKSHSALAEGVARTHGCPPAQESDLDFVFPPARKGFRRQMLPVSGGRDVCRVQKRSSDGRLRSPVRSPHQRLEFLDILGFPCTYRIFRTVQVFLVFFSRDRFPLYLRAAEQSFCHP